MRDPNSRNHIQQSLYVEPALWEAARAMAKMNRQTISSFIVTLIEKQKNKMLGKRWKPS